MMTASTGTAASSDRLNQYVDVTVFHILQHNTRTNNLAIVISIFFIFVFCMN